MPARELLDLGARFSTPAARYPQAYQHKLLINNDLRRWSIGSVGDDCCGMSHTATDVVEKLSAWLQPSQAVGWEIQRQSHLPARVRLNPLRRSLLHV